MSRIFPLTALITEVSRINNGVFEFRDIIRRQPRLYAARMFPDESFERRLFDQFVEHGTFDQLLLLSGENVRRCLFVAFLLRIDQRLKRDLSPFAPGLKRQRRTFSPDNKRSWSNVPC